MDRFRLAKERSMKLLADDLRLEFNDRFAALALMPSSRRKSSGKCPKIMRCLICTVPKHTVAWAYRGLGSRKVEAAGGTCSCCVYACALFCCSRSVPLLVQIGVVEAVRKLSLAIREERGGKDVCSCHECCA